MVKYIIAGAILLVGAVVLGVSWFWTKKLLDKRAEGLDRRQEEIEKREALLEQAVQVETAWMRPVRIRHCVYLTEGVVEHCIGDGYRKPGVSYAEAFQALLRAEQQRAIDECLTKARKYVLTSWEDGENSWGIYVKAEMVVQERRTE